MHDVHRLMSREALNCDSLKSDAHGSGESSRFIIVLVMGLGNNLQYVRSSR